MGNSGCSIFDAAIGMTESKMAKGGVERGVGRGSDGNAPHLHVTNGMTLKYDDPHQSLQNLFCHDKLTFPQQNF